MELGRWAKETHTGDSRDSRDSRDTVKRMQFATFPLFDGVNSARAHTRRAVVKSLLGSAPKL